MEARANLYCRQNMNGKREYDQDEKFMHEEIKELTNMKMVVNMTMMNMLRLFMKKPDEIQEILKSKREIKKCLIGKWLNDIT